MAEIVTWTLFEENPANPDSRSAERFLSPEEDEKYQQFKFPKRRREWLLGRMAAKHLLINSQAGFSTLSSRSFSIRNEPDGAPYFVTEDGKRLPGCLSISHTRHLALCALTLAGSLQVGVDLESIEPRFPAMVDDFFTPAEIESVRACPPEQHDLLITLIWSAKESMLKVLRKGLRLDTRQVEIYLHSKEITDQLETSEGNWLPLGARCHDCGRGIWSVAWRRMGDFILTSASYSEGGEKAIRWVRV